MRCGGADLGGCQCSDGLSGGYGAAACPPASFGSACSAQWCFNAAPLTAPADRRSATPRLPFVPEDGLEVVASGKLTTYPGRSKYQIVIERMELAGEGALLALTHMMMPS